MCVGAAQGALEHATRYMNDRVIAGKPIALLQGLQWKLADMAIALEGARLLLARAVRLAGSGGTPPALETAMAKTAANLAAKFVCDEAIQLHWWVRLQPGVPGGAGLSGHPRALYRCRTIEAQRNFVGSSVARGVTTASPGWMNPLVD